MIRVALVDDQAMFRAGIAMVLDSQPDLEVVGQAADGDEVAGAGRRRASRRRGHGRPDARASTASPRPVAHPALGEAAPRVLVLTTFDLDEAAVAAIEAGASGFVLKDARPELLLAAVRAVADGNQVVAAGATRTLLERFRTPRAAPGREYDELTPREREILLRAAAGLSNAEIAAVEHLSEATVKTHVSRILAKLALRDRVQLVVYAYEHGLLCRPAYILRCTQDPARGRCARRPPSLASRAWTQSSRSTRSARSTDTARARCARSTT